MNDRRKINIKPGDRFGKLTIIERAEDYIVDNGSDKITFIRYVCRCDCGNTVVREKYELVCGACKSCGC